MKREMKSGNVPGGACRDARRDAEEEAIAPKRTSAEVVKRMVNDCGGRATRGEESVSEGGVKTRWDPDEENGVEWVPSGCYICVCVYIPESIGSCPCRIRLRGVPQFQR